VVLPRLAGRPLAQLLRADRTGGIEKRLARLTLTAEPLAASAVSAAAALLQTAYVLAETDEQVQAVSQIARPFGRQLLA